MSTNINYTQIVDSIITKVKESIDISEYETKMISNGMLLPRKELPNTKLSLTSLMSEVSSSMADYNYILTKLRTKKLELITQYRPKYDQKFTILTRQLRPSKEAISCEIHYTNPDLEVLRVQMESIDSIVEFLSLQLSVLDKLYKSVEARMYAV